MSESTQDTNQLQQEFHDLVRQAVIDGLSVIQKAISEKKYLGGIYNWTSISWRDNGMPNFSQGSNSPLDYMSAFSPAIGKEPPEPSPVENLESFKNLHQFIIGNEFLRERLLPYWANEENDEFDFIGITIKLIPEKLASRYAYFFDLSDFQDDMFQQIYRPFEASIFDEELSLEICVPILFLNFSFNDVRISEQVRIARMTEDFQLSRYRIKAYGPGVHDSVLSCATHALVLENWNTPNRNSHQIDELFSNVDAFPNDHIERFFGALRTVCSHPTGYCQLLINPIGWADDWTAHLPTVNGTSVRSYPSFFEKFYWNENELPMLSVDDMAQVGIAFRRLMEAKENSLAIAVRRLNRCYCRDDEEDWVIDATIALEALLSDSEPQEMTHKLALRVAALSQLVPGQEKTSNQVFNDIKQVYRLRSKIVHGKSPKDKDRIIAISDEEEIPISQIARDHLRDVLKVLIERPEYRDPLKVDQYIIAKLTSPMINSDT